MMHISQQDVARSSLVSLLTSCISTLRALHSSSMPFRSRSASSGLPPLALSSASACARSAATSASRLAYDERMRQESQLQRARIHAASLTNLALALFPFEAPLPPCCCSPAGSASSFLGLPSNLLMPLSPLWPLDSALATSPEELCGDLPSSRPPASLRCDKAPLLDELLLALPLRCCCDVFCGTLSPRCCGEGAFSAALACATCSACASRASSVARRSSTKSRPSSGEPNGSAVPSTASILA